MTTAIPNTASANFCALSKIVSNAGLQRIMFAEDFELLGRQMKRLLQKTGIEPKAKSSLFELIEVCYGHLLKNYRHEYLYKAALLNSYVLDHYSLSDTILLNEFKIGNSKADAVLVNGTNKVFEIKTELDSPERLASQIQDYYKAFSEVFIVIHHSELDKYLKLVDENIGIMLFSPENTVQPFRSAQPYHDGLDTTAMMKALRKEEYVKVVKNLCGIVPQAPPVKLFKSCLQALSQFSEIDVQHEFMRVIKHRINPVVNELIQNPLIPSALRFSCYHYNPNKKDYLSLIERLNYKL